MKLTANEIQFLNDMKFTDYGNPIDNQPTWWFAIETSFDTNVAKGITASLVKKGLITSEYSEEDGEYITAYTAKGLELVKSFDAPAQGSTPKAPSKPRKVLTDEQYIMIAEDFISSVNATKAAIAKKYGIHPSTISDMFSEKYCRKSCKEAIAKLKGGN